MKARAFAPCHITGFFQICDDLGDPLLKGSRGAGVSVSRGVTTTVEVTKASAPQIFIEINEQSKEPAPVSEKVISRILKLRPRQSFNIRVTHDVALPIGCGFGTSGAAALSLSLALNKALDLGLTRIEAAQIAHIVEVECQTGLGTVIAEMVGGIEIRVYAGAPGFGQIETLPTSDEYMVVCLPFGPIPTPQYLNDSQARQRINERGGLLTDALRGNPTVANFLSYSRHFAEHIEIITKRVKSVFEQADAEGFTCSSAIFGENVFSVVLAEEIPKLTSILNHHSIPDHDVLIMNIDCKGARVIDE